MWFVVKFFLFFFPPWFLILKLVWFAVKFFSVAPFVVFPFVWFVVKFLLLFSSSSVKLRVPPWFSSSLPSSPVSSVPPCEIFLILTVTDYPAVVDLFKGADWQLSNSAVVIGEF